MSWKKVKFEELYISPSRNGIYKSAESRGSGCKIVNMGEIFAFDFIGSQKMQRIALSQEELNRFGLQNGDLLFARRSLVESGAGKSSLVVNINEPTTFESSIIRVRLDLSKCVPLFYHYWLRSLSGRTAISSLVTGTNVKGIRGTELKEIYVDYPDYDTQTRIAEILFVYDRLIENNQKQIKLLEEAAQRLYKEWFVDLRFPGHEKCKIIDGVPEGWENKPLSEVLTFIRGKSYTSKELSETEGTLMVNLKNIRAFGGYNRNAEKRFIGKYKEEQQLNPGDIIMGVTDMTQERRLVGHTAIVPVLKENMTFSMDLIKLIPIGISKNYLYGTMNYGGFSYKISPLANGVNVLHLKPEAMMNLQMLVPTNSIMKAFDDNFNSVCSRIELLQEQIGIAIEARGRLVPKLMSGEICV